MSWFSDIFSGGSEARKKAEMYAKVERDLGDQIAKLEEELNHAEENRRYKYEAFMNGGGTAEGRLLTDFENAVNTWNYKYNSIKIKMNNGLEIVRQRKTMAAQMKMQYEIQAQMEEMMANG